MPRGNSGRCIPRRSASPPALRQRAAYNHVPRKVSERNKARTRTDSICRTAYHAAPTPAARGGKWSAVQVARLLEAAKKAAERRLLLRRISLLMMLWTAHPPARQRSLESLYYGSPEISFSNSDSDQALEVVVRTLPSAPVASANLATFSPLEDSTMRSRSCSPEVR